MLANYHTHTFRCRHAKGSDRNYIEHAIAGGMKVLGFSDHCPWIFDDGFVSDIRMLPDWTDDYFSSLTDLKKEYASDITIYIGFESEYIPELMEAQNEFLSGYPVDYMILGEHFTQREPYGRYTGSESSDADFFKSYIDLLIEGMKTGKYKYAAHPDLFNFVGSDDVYCEQYSRLCRFFKSENIPVEINLPGLINGRHYSSEKFLKIAGEIGNTAIIGCDAHLPEVLSADELTEKCREAAKKHNLALIDYLPGLEPITKENPNEHF